MAISNEPWSNFSDSDYPDAAALCDASLINLNTGPRRDWTKANCKLRVYEPDGDLNRNGVAAAWNRLAGAGGGVMAPSAAKRAAARKLMQLYRQCGMPVPDAMRQMAGM